VAGRKGSTASDLLALALDGGDEIDPRNDAEVPAAGFFLVLAAHACASYSGS
jgi:hypothetical protein